ncbi:MAG: hypothetical protein RSE01_09010 [Akkermansia sp.]
MDSGFGTIEHINFLRRCRTNGLTMGQVQVLCVLMRGEATKSDIEEMTGMSDAGCRKSIKACYDAGDITHLRMVEVKRGCIVPVWGLSDHVRGIL